MVNQNFINLMSLHGLFDTGYTKECKKIDGTDVIIDYSTYIDLGRFSRNKKTYYDLTLDTSRQYANEATFGFGSGTKEPNIDDFSLESVFADNVFTVETFNYNVENNSYKPKYMFTITYKYTGTDTITISEVGMFTKLSISASVTTAPLMLARGVLETPITVSNNDIFTVTMTLS